MRLLIFNWQDRTHPQAGGAEVHLHEIFSRIARMGHDVNLVCCRHPDAKQSEVVDGIKVVRIGARPFFNYVVPAWWLKNGKKLNPDVVIDDINKIPFFTPLYIKRPILAIIHHFFGQSIFNEAGRLSGEYVHLFEERIASVYRNTPICTVSESTKSECVERGLNAANISLIYNALDPSAFPMHVGVKTDSPTVVYFGRLKKYKSVDHLIKAFATVRTTLPGATLDILGTGDDSSNLKQLAAELGMQDCVNFRGYVTDSEKVEYLSRAHVAVNTSIKEGWGITNLEANACGTPVISANVPGLRDSVKNGESGILYEYGDLQDLSAKITHVLTNDSERNRLSNGAVEWSKSFTWDKSAEEMIKLCELVANTR